MKDLYLIVGLGNPGRKYDKTRHNTGFHVLDAIAKKTGTEVKRKAHRAVIGIGRYEGLTFILAKPQTYMNLSGESIRAIMEYYGIPMENLLVISDDVYLDPGVLRLRNGGSAGGHNGLKNIILQLAGDGFKRLRVGVGQKPEKEDLVDFVLENFRKEEVPVMKEAYERAADAAIAVFTEGMDAAMCRYNGKKE